MNETKLKVTLLNYTPNPEETVAMAARLCYSNLTIEDIKNISEKNYKKLIKNLIQKGHLSPIEHVSFTFGIEGISRACSHQLVRHRLASYSQQSQRYVNLEETFNFIIPPSIKQNPDIEKLYIDFMKNAQETYKLIIKKFNEKGIKGELAYQDARFVLPNACETKIIVTMNARELLHFFKLRCCQRAQWEIRLLAEKMLQLVKKVAPTIFFNAGPSCLSGKCPENKNNCNFL